METQHASQKNIRLEIPCDIKLIRKLFANANFSLRAAEFAKLVNTPVINASFVAHNGSISGIDPVRATQFISKVSALNSSTRFDKFSGKLLLKDGHYQYR